MGSHQSAVHFGDCRDVMRGMVKRGEKVQMCVTSPPYFGLRDYGVDGQLGLESSPAEFVTNMVDVFALVHELLSEDGTLWVNIGDSYNAAGRTGHGSRVGFKQGTNRASSERKDQCRPSVSDLKPKDLIGIPWRLAFALQDWGWYLRQDIIWHKPNPMPESVTDRCTKSHEYIFLLSKREKYYFDQQAIKEPCESGESDLKKMREGKERIGGKHKTLDDKLSMASAHTNIGQKRSVGNGESRNRRSVWSVATQAYSGAHFAVYPTALIEPCILAGSRPGDIVLDPFFGSGTTGQVCNNLGRNYIGIELNREYEQLQLDRTAQSGLIF